MTTTQDAPTISQLLKSKRGNGSKADAYRAIGVSPGTYNMWEAGGYIPEDAYTEKLAEYLGIDEREMAWMQYRERKARKGVYVSSFSLRSFIPLAA